MQESVLIEWLNDNVGAVQATTTIILVAITAYYAWQTKRNVQLLEKTEEETRRPHIAVYITQREEWFNIIDLIIGNYGSGIARDILFKIDNDLELLNKNEKLKDIEILKNGLPTLAPNQIIRIPLLLLIGRIDELQKKNITISLEYKDYSRKRLYTDRYIISFKSLVERQLGSPPLYKMAKDMEKIRKGIEEISKDMKHIRLKDIIKNDEKEDSNNHN